MATVAALRESERGACYRIGDGWYVLEDDFIGVFGSSRERAAWMCLRNAELAGDFEEELSRLSWRSTDAIWADSELDRLLLEDLAGCYFTEL